MIIRIGILLALVASLLGPVRVAAECGACTECTNPRLEDTLLCGCFEGTSGQVGFTEVLGDSGAVVTVDIVIETVTPLTTFGIDLEFPSHLLEYDTTFVGSLAVDIDQFGANLHPNGQLVRVAGWETGSDEIPAGVSGTLAVHQFRIKNVGCGTMCIADLWDGVDEQFGYFGCTLGDGTSVDDPLESSTWGRIKAAYQ